MVTAADAGAIVAGAGVTAASAEVTAAGAEVTAADAGVTAPRAGGDAGSGACAVGCAAVQDIMKDTNTNTAAVVRILVNTETLGLMRVMG